ncbi:MAG: hypothetical protein ACR2JY_02935, partial [Chloroflexota bacterium]
QFRLVVVALLHPLIDAEDIEQDNGGFSPQVLAGHSWQDIATAQADPKAAISQGIVGTANYLTAGLCHLTGDKPGTACTVAPIPPL